MKVGASKSLCRGRCSTCSAHLIALATKTRTWKRVRKHNKPNAHLVEMHSGTVVSGGNGWADEGFEENLQLRLAASTHVAEVVPWSLHASLTDAVSPAIAV